MASSIEKQFRRRFRSVCKGSSRLLSVASARARREGRPRWRWRLSGAEQSSCWNCDSQHNEHSVEVAVRDRAQVSRSNSNKHGEAEDVEKGEGVTFVRLRTSHTLHTLRSSEASWTLREIVVAGPKVKEKVRSRNSWGYLLMMETIPVRQRYPWTVPTTRLSVQ